MPKPIYSAVLGAFKAVGAVGSLFVSKNQDGKYSVAIAPLALVMVLGTGITCSVQQTEPFSVCVRNTVESLKELIHAN